MKEIPILILHGWRVPVERYLPLKKFFINLGFEVLIPQLPGFSKSEALSKVYTLDDYVKFTVDFVKKNKLDSFFLIGHSFGGRVAIKLTVFHPEKVKALVLTGVPAVRGRRFKRFIFLILAKIGKALFAVHPLSFLKQGAIKTLYCLADEWDYYQTEGLMRETFKKIVAEDLNSILPQIKAPTLLIWGEKDRIVPFSVAQKLLREISGAKLSIIANASHKLPYEKAKRFSEECLKFFSHHGKF